MALLVWRISKDNINWGRTRISNQLKLLNIFLAASTVRNILQRPSKTNIENALNDSCDQESEWLPYPSLVSQSFVEC